MLCHCVIAKLVISLFPKVDDFQKQWVSVVRRLKRKTKHGSQALLMWVVSVTSPIRITDRLNHSESNIEGGRVGVSEGGREGGRVGGRVGGREGGSE